MEEKLDTLFEVREEIDRKISRLIDKKLNDLALRLGEKSLNCEEVKDEVGKLVGGRTKEIVFLLEKLIEKLNRKREQNKEIDKLKKEFAVRLLYQVRNQINQLFLDFEIKITDSRKLFKEIGQNQMEEICKKIEKVVHKASEYFEHETKKYYALI